LGGTWFYGAFEALSHKAPGSAGGYLLLPSYAEAYPTVLIEAAACGTPFVATEVAGILDIAQQSKAGATAPPGDIDAMEKAILRFLNDQETWTEASRHGRDWARQQTIEKMVDEWRKLL
jgi:glycosyltransferase involved in cell wall biosynthesis